MAGHYSYDVTKFASTDDGYFTGSTVGGRYQVRFLLRDTGSINASATKPFLVADEEIDLAQTLEMNAFRAAARVARTLVAAAGSVAQRKIGDLQVTYDVKFYQALALELEARGAGYQQAFVGGVSVADKLTQEANADAVQPTAFRSQFDNPRAEQPMPGSTPSPTVQAF